MMSLFALTVLFAGAAQGCEVQSTPLADFGGTVTMQTKAGETCVYDLLLSAGTSARNAAQSQRNNFTILSLQIREKPSHGRAGTSGRTGIAYAAAPGFSGSDRFSAELTTERDGHQRTSTVTVSVQAQR